MKSFADFLVIFNSETLPKSRNESSWIPVQTPHENSKAFYCFSDSHFGPSLIQEKKEGAWRYWILGEIDGSPSLAPVENLNGHFLLIGMNQQSHEWHVWTNRLGTFHAYYATDGKRAAIGTFFPAVADAASAKGLDWEGLSGFFNFGFFPQDRTYFKDVRILRPATHYVFDRDGKLLKQSRYWNWTHQPHFKRSFEDTVQEFGSTLETILKDQTRHGRMAMPISSGLDSRTVAAVVTQDGENFQERLWAYSYGYNDDSQETAIAARVASARHLPFERFTIGAYLFDRLPLILNSVEGFQGIASTRQAAITHQMASHADYLLAAHMGDVWMDDMGLAGKNSDPTNEERILEYTLHKIQKPGKWLLENICRPQLGNKDPDELLGEMVREELRKLRHLQDPDFRVKAFKTDQWSFRWTCAGLRMFQPGAFPRLPFYDNRMVDFCATVPSTYVQGRRLQIEYLKQFHPDLARITWDVTDSSLYHSQYYNTWLLPKRVYKKALRWVTGKRHIGRNWEVQFLNEKGQEGLRRHLLHNGLRVHQYIAPAQIETLIRDVTTQPDGSNGYVLSQLLTFSIGLEYFH